MLAVEKGREPGLGGHRKQAIRGHLQNWPSRSGQDKVVLLSRRGCRQGGALDIGDQGVSALQTDGEPEAGDAIEQPAEE